MFLFVEILSFLILICFFFCQVLFYRIGKSFIKTSKYLFWLPVVLMIFYYFYLVWAQYLVWKNGEGIAKFLVPPYKSIFYVFDYHFARFALYYFIAFAAALFLLFVSNYFNKKFGEKFFKKEEPYLAALAIFLLGNPAWHYAWIYYIFSLLLISLGGSLITVLFLKKKERFSLYWLWLPVAILIILIQSFL